MNQPRGDLPWELFNLMLGTAVAHSATHHKPWELRLELDGGLEPKKSLHAQKYICICTWGPSRSRTTGRLSPRIAGSWSHIIRWAGDSGWPRNEKTFQRDLHSVEFGESRDRAQCRICVSLVVRHVVALGDERCCPTGADLHPWCANLADFLEQAT